MAERINSMAVRGRYLRFPIAYRVEHWVMVASFVTLAITGLAQKFAQTGIAVWLIGGLGGIETVRVIHRVAAIVLILEAVYHVGAVGYNLLVRRYGLDLMLTPQDIRHALHAFQYNLGWRNDPPQQGRYTFEEKFEYFAIVWGTIVMAATGFVLWNPIAATSALPGEFVPAAKAVHSGEALLAVLAIIVWHMYHVHFRRFNRSMFTGYLPAEVMEEEHPLELAEREQQAASDGAQHEPAYVSRRTYLGVYTVITVLVVAGIYALATFERTAIETVPSAEDSVTIYAPLREDPQPVLVSFDGGMTSWADGIGALFELKCAFCHGGSTPLSKLDLTSYESALLGGSSVPAIVPNDPENSGIIIEQQTGDHPVTLTAAELEKLSAWIEAGAPSQ